MRWGHYPRWFVMGAVLLLLALWWQLEAKQRNIVYFDARGQVVTEHSAARYVRQFRRDGDNIKAEDFYYPKRVPYRSAFVTVPEQVRRFTPEVRDGELVLWYADGKKQTQGNYRNGKPDGLWQTWHDNGQLAAEIHYRNGVPEGPVTRWYANGRKLGQLTFVQGKGNGKWQRWYDNGQLKSEAMLHNGQVQTLTTWDTQGRITADLAVQNHKQNGVVLTWYPNGDKKSESVFEQNELVRKTEWDEDGNIVDLE